MPSTSLIEAEPTVQAALPAMPSQDTRRGQREHLRGRVAGLLRRKPETGASYYDPLFAAPDVVENDYCRLRHQPRG